VVHDKSEDGASIATFLRGAGYQVAEAETATAALFKLRTMRPELIVTGLPTRGIDGSEFARQLRGNPATSAIPVICGTAAHAAGPEDILRAVKEILGGATKAQPEAQLDVQPEAQSEVGHRRAAGCAGAGRRRELRSRLRVADRAGRDAFHNPITQDTERPAD
jgi:CheY-like chemotaxis protein